MLDLFDLRGKVALVSGGGTGLGRRMADALAECGAAVAVVARKADRCEAAAAEISEAFGVRAMGGACDVQDPAAIDETVRRTMRELGRIDILVNNAGTSWGALPEEMPLEGWQKVLDVNLTGSFLLAQRVGRALIAQGDGGKIVNISSALAFRGSPPGAVSAIAYNASKGGLVSMTIDLAVQWAPHGICVNAIAPGWFPTDMSHAVLERGKETLLAGIPMRRFGGPDDLKGAVAYLTSAASDYVTGQTLAVDGGLLAA